MQGTIGRFRLDAVLGSGGMGVVYRAFDPMTNRHVALKTFLKVTSGQRSAIKREFRLLADVLHPNLVQLYELHADETECFFTMELVEGATTFEHWCRDADPQQSAKWREALYGPTLAADDPQLVEPPAAAAAQGRPNVDMGRLKTSLGQLSEGLRAMHGAGLVHCDVKPSNVVITPLGRTVLLDFGVATGGGADAVHAGGLHGTPSFMAPEQLAGKAPSPAADWYAVGAMLHLTVTGRLPFESVQSRYAGGLHRAPAYLANPIDQVPSRLADLIQGLLDPDPRRRFGAPQVAGWLGQIRPAQPSFRTSQAIAVGLVGRARELAHLRSWLEVAGRTPVAVRLAGPSGIGKSALLRHFLQQAVTTDQVVALAGRCHPMVTLPFKAFDELVESLARRMEAGLFNPDLQAIAPAELAALTSVFPVLSEPIWRRRPRAPAPPQPTERRRAAFGALASLFADLAREATPVVWIDDWQWTDADSMDLLASLLAHPVIPRLLLVLSHRPDAELVQRLDSLEAATPRVQWHAMALTALGGDDATALVQQSLLSADPAAIEGLRHAIDEAGGSPFLLRQIATVASQVQQSAWQGRPLAQLLSVQTSSLDAAELAVLQAVAVSGAPVPRAVVGRLPGTLEGLHNSIELLRKRCLVRFNFGGEGQTLLPYHDRVGDAVLAELDAEQLAALHAALAKAWQAEADPLPEPILRHLEGAGDLVQAGHYAVLAAERASAALAFDQAASAWAKAIALGATDLPRWQLFARQAESLADCGRGALAADAWVEAARLAEPLAGEATAEQMRQNASVEYLRVGRVDQGMGLLREVLAKVGWHLPGGRGRAIADMLWQRARLAMRGLDFRLRDGELPATDARYLDTLWAAATGVSFLDFVKANALGVAHLRGALDLGDRRRILRSLAYEACYHSMLGGHAGVARAEAMLETAKGLALDPPEPYETAWLALGKSSLAYFAGHFRVAYEQGLKGARIFATQCRAVSWEISSCQGFVVSALPYLGRFDELRTRLPDLIAEEDSRGATLAATGLHLGPRSLLWLADHGAARWQADADTRMAWWWQNAPETHAYEYVLAACQAALYQGQVALARHTFDEHRAKVVRGSYYRVQFIAAELYDLEGRILLAEAAQRRTAKNKAILNQVRALANKLATSPVAVAQVFRGGLLAGVAWQGGDGQTAAQILGETAQQASDLDLALHATAMGWALATCRQDRAAMATARTAVAALGVVAPQAMAHMLLPGIPIQDLERGAAPMRAEDPN